MIFLDNASTTSPCGDIGKILDIACRSYYNPSALYGEALKVKNMLEDARKEIANLLGADKSEIYFTSCATESNNWAYEKGIKNKKGNIVVSASEHASGYESAMAQKSKGVDVRFAALNKDGSIDEDDLFDKIDENTCFVSVIHCSNETGTLNDIASIVKKIRSVNPKIVIHSDGVQAFLKYDYNIKELGVDLYSISAHKIGGLKGIGALFIKKGLNIAPLIVGGGQEFGARSGTENVAGILSFAQAAKHFKQNYDRDMIIKMRKYMISELMPLNVKINGNQKAESILSVTIPGIKAEILQHMLSDKGVLIGLGSACSSRSRNNRVLSAIGLDQKEIEGSIRISFGIENDMKQIIAATDILKTEINDLRGNMR